VGPREAALAAVPGSASKALATVPTPTTPDPSVQLATRATYRQLILKGMAPDEAANLTAFMCGIPVADVHWSLQQVNRLLFLRELARTGRFGAADGTPDRPH
jgi:hypothetical protein